MKPGAAARAAVAVALAAGALGVAGEAPAATSLQLAPGDSFTIAGTHLRCTFEPAKRIGCVYVLRSRPSPGSYSVSLSAAGEAVLARVGPDGTLRVVERRKPAVAGRASKVYRLRVGDSVLAMGTNVICTVQRSRTSGPSVVCFRFSATRRRVERNSYGIGITDKDAFLVRFDAQSHATVDVLRKHGS